MIRDSKPKQKNIQKLKLFLIKSKKSLNKQNNLKNKI
jgi:hypothetical protein